MGEFMGFFFGKIAGGVPEGGVGGGGGATVMVVVVELVRLIFFQ